MRMKSSPKHIPLDIVYEDKYLMVVNNLPVWWCTPVMATITVRLSTP